MEMKKLFFLLLKIMIKYESKHTYIQTFELNFHMLKEIRIERSNSHNDKRINNIQRNQ